MLMRAAIAPTTASPSSRPIAKSVGDAHTIAGVIGMMGARMSYGRNVEIFGEGEPAEYIYKVVSGAVRSCRVLDDGRRQVTAFHTPGDVFGLDIGQEHRFSAEAITDTVIMIVKRTAIVSLAGRDGEIARELWTLTAQELHRVQDHMLVLGCMSAKERVASFLLEMARHGSSGNEVELPMSRQDIADYLGLTIETVSRIMTQLEHDATIGLPTSRRIVLRNRAALSRLNA
jgi:CRP/FNR family nitrogen fixation transcriptional regulator